MNIDTKVTAMEVSDQFKTDMGGYTTKVNGVEYYVTECGTDVVTYDACATPQIAGITERAILANANVEYDADYEMFVIKEYDIHNIFDDEEFDRCYGDFGDLDFDNCEKEVETYDDMEYRIDMAKVYGTAEIKDVNFDEKKESVTVTIINKKYIGKVRIGQSIIPSVAIQDLEVFDKNKNRINEFHDKLGIDAYITAFFDEKAVNDLKAIMKIKIDE